ncbi:hypothetical protein [Bartonella tribocorum]|uniref:Uncharacterized protein n=1 Tax=Bartonella tribocorum TaxID=85701 RepID=A0A2M6UT03_9HYPH|nr:hypothetical protein [Bartonella tribocorum]PIT69329.1 hypothetical protein CER18_03775 [Bartonella tribocorum]
MLFQESNIIKPLRDRQWIEEKLSDFLQKTLPPLTFLHFLILTAVYTNPWRHIREDQIEENNGKLLTPRI